MLLNRRGWSNFLSCRSCGQVWECPHCDVALVLHRAAGAVACHHCGHREPRRRRAATPAARSSVARHGAGTERLEHELAEALGPAPVFRLDADTAAARRGRRLLDALRPRAGAACSSARRWSPRATTSPTSTLGVVLDADATLRFPDFRAEERTFALVAQLAGRAGRGAGGGRVLVQTLAPDAPSIVRAARHDADGFLAGELARREALRYPPFATLIRVVCSPPRPRRPPPRPPARRAAAARPPGAAVLGPAPLFRLRGRERSQLVVKARAAARRSPPCAAAVEAVARRPPRAAPWRILGGRRPAVANST